MNSTPALSKAERYFGPGFVSATQGTVVRLSHFIVGIDTLAAAPKAPFFESTEIYREKIDHRQSHGFLASYSSVESIACAPFSLLRGSREIFGHEQGKLRQRTGNLALLPYSASCTYAKAMSVSRFDCRLRSLAPVAVPAVSGMVVAIAPVPTTPAR
jgi:hypothetical protein